jgi:N-acetyl-alpha-D-muramate 1-phosphate uridylyltransferase
LQAVILAGGLGTRLLPLTENMPKPMVPVAGKPFLDRELHFLRKNGFREFVICVGYKSSMIEDYFEDGHALNISIIYSEDGKKQLGPAGALKKAASCLQGEFLATYGDSFLQLDYAAFINKFHSSGKLGMMTVLENHNKYGKSDVVVQNGLVTKYDKSGMAPDMNWINYGASLLRKEALDFIPESVPVGEEQFYGELVRRKELAAFPTYERFYEIGTVRGLREFETFVSENTELFEN